jgi:phospholipid-binding lipoprotein MlaA
VAPPPADSEGDEAEPWEVVEEIEEEVPPVAIADPLEPLNRVFFHFNDKLYFWFLKPAASAYSKVLPEGMRVSVRRFFSNLTTPIRFANCLLQGKVRGAAIELSRLVINTTLGVAGLFDPAKDSYHLSRQEEDFGQTLGVYRIGAGVYINWPVFGPSSVRDTAGFVGDLFLDPVTYLLPLVPERLAADGGERINETSLTLGDYEDLKEAALDPYVALRNAYHQHRQSAIEQ